ncbi:uncharacterized protein A1O9_11404 [Exophiala aquamarina CBS 119918]|uniref:Uncharacterized protein n=1 Tax=Exophiala aquamarina CBS 119918 TaxID=1182545 RepID=A0A072NY78_9EURO|nr:uncharacterized protein A1O9_11404 [Exophiala aquamarina CBS 119918]KEF52561.1 hypothetical protein A1O9_11404 [Exophiala aquamarina CBS 119918]
MKCSRTIFLTLSSAALGTCAIQWAPCDPTKFNTTILPFQCGNLAVPLDYTDPANEQKLSLDLIKIPAASGPKLGSILFNLGGPGVPNLRDISLLAPTLLPLTGGQSDLIGLDPRGTGNTIPFNCTTNLADSYTMLTEKVFSNSSDVTLGRLWSRGSIDASLCLENANETGALISTAFVARDLISIVDALEEDGMLRYWGFSYGTTLGATVTAMFPERVDKVILDGVQNPHEYYHAIADFEEWTDSDKVFAGIFSTCIEAGPELCPLAARNKTAQELESDVWDLLDTVKHHPLPVGSVLLDYMALKGMITEALYTTELWPNLATTLDILLHGPESALTALATYLVAGGDETELESGMKTITAIAGIHCGDNLARVSTFKEFQRAVDKLYNISRIMGDVPVSRYAVCAQWKIKPKENYNGDFIVRTKKPLLIIGNTYDGHTPLRSAQNVSQGYEGSVVLEVNGYGHASINLPSKCTLETVSAYWVNGIMPEPGKVCQVDAPPYSGKSWADVFESAGVGSLQKRDVYGGWQMLRNGGRMWML